LAETGENSIKAQPLFGVRSSLEDANLVLRRAKCVGFEGQQKEGPGPGSGIARREQTSLPAPFRISGLGGSSNPWSSSAPREPWDQSQDEHHKEDEEQELCDSGRRYRDVTKTEYRGDDRDNEKYHCPIQHAASSRFVTSIVKA